MYFFNLFLVLILSFSFESQAVFSLNMDSNNTDLCVIEELRIQVPSDLKQTWLKAEREVWDPWLSMQDGFLGRQIFWNKDKEEALILVNWKNKKLWKSISIEEVNKIQEKFEDNVKTSLDVDVNPFKLVYEGELDKQK